MDTRLSLLMNQLNEFYSTPNKNYITQIQNIIEQQNNDISLRILDWFITNYSKKYRISIKKNNGVNFDVYTNYKLKLKSYSKRSFDPFCRKNKITFYYDPEETKYIETSCGQLCFFKWCFENDILDFVRKHIDIIENDMKSSLKIKKEEASKQLPGKRAPVSTLAGASRSITKTHVKYTLKFD